MPGTHHNTGGLAFWFLRAERYKQAEGMLFPSVRERGRKLQSLPARQSPEMRVSNTQRMSQSTTGRSHGAKQQRFCKTTARYAEKQKAQKGTPCEKERGRERAAVPAPRLTMTRFPMNRLPATNHRRVAPCWGGSPDHAPRRDRRSPIKASRETCGRVAAGSGDPRNAATRRERAQRTNRQNSISPMGTVSWAALRRSVSDLRCSFSRP